MHPSLNRTHVVEILEHKSLSGVDWSDTDLRERLAFFIFSRYRQPKAMLERIVRACHSTGFDFSAFILGKDLPPGLERIS